MFETPATTTAGCHYDGCFSGHQNSMQSFRNERVSFTLQVHQNYDPRTARLHGPTGCFTGSDFQSTGQREDPVCLLQFFKIHQLFHPSHQKVLQRWSTGRKLHRCQDDQRIRQWSSGSGLSGIRCWIGKVFKANTTGRWIQIGGWRASNVPQLHWSTIFPGSTLHWHFHAAIEHRFDWLTSGDFVTEMIFVSLLTIFFLLQLREHTFLSFQVFKTCNSPTDKWVLKSSHKTVFYITHAVCFLNNRNAFLIEENCESVFRINKPSTLRQTDSRLWVLNWLTQSVNRFERKILKTKVIL